MNWTSRSQGTPGGSGQASQASQASQPSLTVEQVFPQTKSSTELSVDVVHKIMLEAMEFTFMVINEKNAVTLARFEALEKRLRDLDAKIMPVVSIENSPALKVCT